MFIELNAEQETVASHIDGSILLLAPFGTGKTRTLTQRVLNAVKSGIEPDRILCLSFTNRAADEMRGRIKAANAEIALMAQIKTFHSFCAWFLRQEGRVIGIAPTFTILDDQDSIDLFKEAARSVLGANANGDTDKKAREWYQIVATSKASAKRGLLTADFDVTLLFAELGIQAFAVEYQRRLQETGSLDFGDLVLYTRLVLNAFTEIRERYAERFQFVQVDEVQDTTLEEYEVVALLASGHRRLALIGDIDQTIYEWRGSVPAEVLDAYNKDFSPSVFKLEMNYRSTAKLIGAASSFAESFAKRETRLSPGPQNAPGEPVVIAEVETTTDEDAWIDRHLERLRVNPDFAYARTAILVRTNKDARSLFDGLSGSHPCVTVEEFEFFQRQEIKDAMCRIKLLLNPEDDLAFERATQRPASGIGETTLAKLKETGRDLGLRPSDFIEADRFDRDRLTRSVEQWRTSECVVIDTETTGLDPNTDEVVELAAVAYSRGARRETFRVFIRPMKSVGASVEVHRITDDFLAHEGIPACDAYQRFMDFIGTRRIVGHNVQFDLAMIASHSARTECPVLLRSGIDTLWLARRLLGQARNSLEHLAAQFKIDTGTAHSALDDALATGSLMDRLADVAEKRAEERASFFTELAPRFRGLVKNITAWTEAASRVRPYTLLETILEESGLALLYQKDEKRLRNLDQLQLFFLRHEELALQPFDALRALDEKAALYKNIDALMDKEDRMPIITVFQSKGLEYDSVFIARAHTGAFPSYFAKKEGHEEEEKRLFYVAMTRARQHLFISGPRKVDGWSKGLTTYASRIAKEFVNMRTSPLPRG